jgi:hypothetical protein
VTVFGRPFGGEEIASLVFLLMALGLWVGAWRGERNWARWFRQWEADRKGRRDAEVAAESPDSGPPRTPRGPWG